MTAEIHVGDVGTSFRFLVRDEDGQVIDVSGATGMKIWLRKPNGDVLEFDGSLVNDGTDGLIEYVTESGDLDAPGKWRAQAQVTYGGNVVHTEVTKFEVEANLK